jgi:hypothetical protein
MIEVVVKDKKSYKPEFGPIWPTIEEDMAVYAERIQSIVREALEKKAAEDSQLPPS